MEHHKFAAPHILPARTTSQIVQGKLSSTELAVKTREQVEKGGQHDADQDARAEREEDGDMFSLVGNVARQSPQRQADASRNNQQGSGDSEQKPETKKRFTEFIH